MAKDKNCDWTQKIYLWWHYFVQLFMKQQNKVVKRSTRLNLMQCVCGIKFQKLFGRNLAQILAGIDERWNLNICTDISIPVEPADLTIHSIASSGGRVHFGASDKGDDIASLYGTPKEEIPPTSAGMKSDNGATSFNFTSGNQVPSFDTFSATFVKNVTPGDYWKRQLWLKADWCPLWMERLVTLHGGCIANNEGLKGFGMNGLLMLITVNLNGMSRDVQNWP